MIEITTKEKGFTITFEGVEQPFPFGGVRWKPYNNEILFIDVPTQRNVAQAEISEIKIDGESVTSNNYNDKLMNALFL